MVDLPSRGGGDIMRWLAWAIRKRKQDRAYFGTLQRHLDNGGFAAMLHHFPNWDLDGWHPRNDIPQTEVRGEQQKRTAAPELKWLAAYLDSGVLDSQHPSRPDRVAAGDFYVHARCTVKGLACWTDYDGAHCARS